MNGGYSPSFSTEERKKLKGLLDQYPGISERRISEILGRSRYLIKMEMRIGKGADGNYSIDLAEERRKKNRENQRPKVKLIEPEKIEYLKEAFARGETWSAIRKKLNWNYERIRSVMNSIGYKPSRIDQLAHRMDALEEGFKMLSELVEGLLKEKKA